jgi:hypothetical protein
LIIKHLCNLDDRETVDQISENIYMQYFPGYQSFSNELPFDASLFVEFRKRLGMETVNLTNERIVQLRNREANGDKGKGRNLSGQTPQGTATDNPPGTKGGLFSMPRP